MPVSVRVRPGGEWRRVYGNPTEPGFGETIVLVPVTVASVQIPVIKLYTPYTKHLQPVTVAVAAVAVTASPEAFYSNIYSDEY